MTSQTKTRASANAAFLKGEKQIARDRGHLDIAAMANARDANMNKLRQLRLERDARDRHTAAAMAPAKAAGRKGRKG